MTKEEAIEHLNGCLTGLQALQGETGDILVRVVRPALRFPSLLKFGLTDLFGLPYEWQPIDKVRWSIAARFQGYPVFIEDRKLGFYVAVAAEMDEAASTIFVNKLLGATKITARYIRTLAEPQLIAGNLSLENKFSKHDEAYKYFRGRAAQAYQVPREARAYWESRMEGDCNLVAMLHEYFSRLEHALILMLPANLSFAPGGGNLRRLIGAGWKDKFKALFHIEQELNAKRLFTRLVNLKDEVRNPRAHGGFLSDSRSALFHVERVGALPVDILDRKFHGFSEEAELSFADTCSILDDVDAYLRSHPTIQFGMMAVERGLDIRFDEDFLQDYRDAIRRSVAANSPEPFERLLDDELEAADRYNNYEF